MKLKELIKTKIETGCLTVEKQKEEVVFFGNHILLGEIEKLIKEKKIKVHKFEFTLFFHVKNEPVSKLVLIFLDSEDCFFFHSVYVTREMRITYSVCSFDDNYGYFRNKILKTEKIEEAENKLDELIKDKFFSTPTVIVEETYFKEGKPKHIDFEGSIFCLGFSDRQEIIQKSMCGLKGARWKDFITQEQLREGKYTF